MRVIRRILVAVKTPQASSLPAVLKAAQLARALGAQLELFYSLETPIYLDLSAPGPQSPEESQQELRQRALNSLEAIADRLRLHSLKVTTAVEFDFPAYEAIVRRAMRIKAELIVVCQHAGRHRAPRLLRLTDWELVRLSPLPVLLVKNPHAYRHPAVLAAVDPAHTLAKPPQLDREILRMARAVSRGLHGTLHAVHAFPRFSSQAQRLKTMASGAVASDALRQMERRAERAAKAGLERLLKSTPIARSRRYLLAGLPRDAIAAAARSSRSAVVVMGAISRSGLKGVFIGNTAERILDELSCDILVIKPPVFRNRVPRDARGARVVIIPTVSA